MARERIDIVVTERGAARAARNVAGIGSAARVGSRAVAALGTALAGLGLALTAGELIRLSDSFTRINNQIRLVTDTSEQLVAVQRRVFQIAQDTRTPLEATAGLYRRLATSAQQLGVEQETVFDVVETVGQTLALSGADATAAANGLRQFTQGLDAGILRAEEFNGIIENIPDLAFAIARGLREGRGVTIGEFRRLVLAGEVTSQDLIDALTRVAPEVAEAFAESGRTIDQAFTVLQNGVTQAIGVLDQAIGASDLFGSAIVSVAEDIDVLLIDGFARMLDFIAAGIDGFANLAEVLESFGADAITISNTLRLIGAESRLAFAAIVNGLNVLRLGALSVASALELVGNAFGLVSDEEVLRGLDKLSEANGDLAESSRDVEDAIVDTGLAAQKLADDFFGEEDSEQISRGLRGIAENTRDLASEVRELGREARAAKTAVDGLVGGGGTGDGLPGGFVPADEILQGLGIEDQLGRLVDEETREGIIDAITRVPDEPEVSDAVERLSGQFSSGISGAVGAALRNEGIDFTDFFIDLFTSELEAALSETFESLLDGLESSLGSILGNLGAGGGGEGGAGALSGLGATVGLIGAVAAAGFASTQSSARRGSARSAVDAIAPTRGAIVGPTNVPIFQVGDSIAEAISPLLAEAREQGITLKQILAATQAAGGSDVTAAIDALLQREFNTSTSLG